MAGLSGDVVRGAWLVRGRADLAPVRLALAGGAAGMLGRSGSAVRWTASGAAVELLPAIGVAVLDERLTRVNQRLRRLRQLHGFSMV